MSKEKKIFEQLNLKNQENVKGVMGERCQEYKYRLHPSSQVQP